MLLVPKMVADRQKRASQEKDNCLDSNDNVEQFFESRSLELVLAEVLDQLGVLAGVNNHSQYAL